MYQPTLNIQRIYISTSIVDTPLFRFYFKKLCLKKKLFLKITIFLPLKFKYFKKKLCMEIVIITSLVALIEKTIL